MSNNNYDDQPPAYEGPAEPIQSTEYDYETWAARAPPPAGDGIETVDYDGRIVSIIESDDDCDLVGFATRLAGQKTAAAADDISGRA
jgi:hypothetical protein